MYSVRYVIYAFNQLIYRRGHALEDFIGSLYCADTAAYVFSACSACGDGCFHICVVAFYHLSDFLRSLVGLLSQLAHFVCNDREAASCLSCTCCLYGGVQ